MLVKFGNNWIRKIPLTAKLDSACGLVQFWLSSEFFSSNYFQIGQHVVLLHILIITIIIIIIIIIMYFLRPLICLVKTCCPHKSHNRSVRKGAEHKHSRSYSLFIQIA